MRGDNVYSKISPEHRGFIDVPVESDNFFYGKIVVITGVLETFPYRDDLAAILQAKGARVTSSVSKQTNIVIFGSSPGPSKMKKVDELRALGIDIQYMQEIEMMHLLGISVG